MQKGGARGEAKNVAVMQKARYKFALLKQNHVRCIPMNNQTFWVEYFVPCCHIVWVLYHWTEYWGQPIAVIPCSLVIMYHHDIATSHCVLSQVVMVEKSPSVWSNSPGFTLDHLVLAWESPGLSVFIKPNIPNISTEIVLDHCTVQPVQMSSCWLMGW